MQVYTKYSNWGEMFLIIQIIQNLLKKSINLLSLQLAEAEPLVSYSTQNTAPSQRQNFNPKTFSDFYL